MGAGLEAMLALMKTRGEERKVDCFAHGRVAGMIGMEIIPGQLGELAVGQIFRLHVAGRGIERRRVEIDHAVIQPGGPDIGVEGTVKLRRFGQNTGGRGPFSCRVGRAAPLRRRF